MNDRRAGWSAILFCLLCAASRAFATQPLPEVRDAHPRLFADSANLTALRELAGQHGSVVNRLVQRCTEIGQQPQRFAHAGYMGLDWAQLLQACLVAYQATGQRVFGHTAVIYFRALIDDLTTVGDGAGGDRAAQRDSGFAFRALAPNAALAYDWLHDFPEVDESLRSRARQRFRAWTDWYLAQGYRAHSPGTNYHAGYAFGATLIAIAQGGEAGADGSRLWNHVVDTVWRKETLPAMRDGRVLVGGDWGEGWQYGPLSVVEYSLALRALGNQGLDVSGSREWLDSLVTRHVHALMPASNRTFAVGDTQLEEAFIPVRAETLAAVIAGPASSQSKQWAEAEMRRLRLYEGETFPLFRALAEAAQVVPLEVPRAGMPHHYLAPGTGTLYARFDWSDQSVWFAAQCSRALDVDHTHPNAGNFVLSRGGDPVIVDPSPYGTLSSLTSNAPTVESKVLPREYSPSQAAWSEHTGYRWIRELGDGTLLVRCDYADQYRIQDTASDVMTALRDFILLPANRGHDVIVLVVDRAQTPGVAQGLHLRFRTLARLAKQDGGFHGSIGNTRFDIIPARVTQGQEELRRLSAGDCFAAQYTRGNCDAARFPVSEYRSRLEGARPEAVHVIAAGGGTATHASVEEQGARRLIGIEQAERRVVAVLGADAGPLALPATAATLIFVDVPQRATVTASRAASKCALTIEAGNGTEPADSPWMGQLDGECRLRQVQ